MIIRLPPINNHRLNFRPSIFIIFNIIYFNCWQLNWLRYFSSVIPMKSSVDTNNQHLMSRTSRGFVRLSSINQQQVAENRKYNLPRYWLYFPMLRFLLNMRKFVLYLYLLNPGDISNVYNCCDKHPSPADNQVYKQWVSIMKNDLLLFHVNGIVLTFCYTQTVSLKIQFHSELS